MKITGVNMKRILVLIVLSFTFLLFSCNDNLLEIKDKKIEELKEIKRNYIEKRYTLTDKNFDLSISIDSLKVERDYYYSHSDWFGNPEGESEGTDTTLYSDEINTDNYKGAARFKVMVHGKYKVLDSIIINFEYDYYSSPEGSGSYTNHYINKIEFLFEKVKYKKDGDNYFVLIKGEEIRNKLKNIYIFDLADGHNSVIWNISKYKIKKLIGTISKSEIKITITKKSK